MTAKNNLSNFGRRNALARSRGFRSYSEQRRYRPHIVNADDLAALPADALQARRDALGALSRARREGIGFNTAARRSGIDPAAARWWLGSAVQGTGDSLRVAGGDRIFRSMFVYSGGQAVNLDVRGSRQASLAARYHRAVAAFLDGDLTALEPFRGVTIAGIELEADPDVIEDMGRFGEFEFEDIYRQVNP
jgi:hypothetical protein